MSYDYKEAMRNDIREYLEDTDFARYSNREQLEEALNDELWIADSVTGNGSGSYTFNRYKAMEYVIDNMDLLADAMEEYCIDSKTIGEQFRHDNWEYFDVTIRCYLLNQILSEVLDEMEQNDELPYGKEAENND